MDSLEIASVLQDPCSSNTQNIEVALGSYTQITGKNKERGRRHAGYFSCRACRSSTRVLFGFLADGWIDKLTSCASSKNPPQHEVVLPSGGAAPWNVIGCLIRSRELMRVPGIHMCSSIISSAPCMEDRTAGCKGLVGTQFAEWVHSP